MSAEARRNFATFLLIALLMGCGEASPVPPALRATTQPVSTTQPSPRPADHAAVLLAVFRYQLGGDSGGGRDYYFLSLDAETDPPPEVLSAFADHVPPVLPVSLAVASDKGVTHKERGGSGRIFWIHSIAWRDADTAEVSGGWFATGIAAAGYVYRVERREGKWAVTKSDRKWIS